MADNNEITLDELRYDQMVERALLNVVRESLKLVQKNGLPGDHHFYITFQTNHPGVVIPDHLRARYPGEMTIILQYQFWDLEITEEAFSLTLSFSDVPENLVVPFDAIVAFADPSVRFGLQFDVSHEEGDLPPYDDEEMEDEVLEELEESLKAAAEQEKPKATPEEEGSKVVTLDAFRKK